MDTAISALKRAAKHLGNLSAVAKVVGVTPQAVSERVRKGGKISAEWCIPLEQATGGKVTRHELRPDLYPKGSA